MNVWFESVGEAFEDRGSFSFVGETAVNPLEMSADVLKAIETTSILNQTSRVLANLAEDELGVQELNVIPELLKLLANTSDSDCQQSVLGKLRMVSMTVESKQALLDLDGIKTIVGLLKSEKSAIVNCCIRTVAELTKRCNKEIAQQVQEYGGVKYIVELTSSDSALVRHSALLSLANLAYHAHVRVCIGREGGIQALTRQLEREEPGNVTVKAIEGLCFCCREAINRTRVRESGALELLLKILSSGKYFSLEKRIVSAFTCFQFSQPDLEILINADLVPALISHINRVLSHLPSLSGLEDHNHDFSDQLCFTADISSDSPRAATAKNRFFDVRREKLMDENFCKELEEAAKEVDVSDSKTSSSLPNFKRRKLKRLPIPTTPSSVASSSNSANLSTSSYPSVLTSCQVSTPSNSYMSSLDESQRTGRQTEDLEVVQIERKSTTIKSKYSLMSGMDGRNGESSITTVNSHGSLTCPLSPRRQGGIHHYCWPGHNALALLLFCICHMTDPSSLLVNKSCIQALLHYLRVVDNPSLHSARILDCLASNSLCFKALVVNGAVVAIHHQLCCMVIENQETAATARECTAVDQDSEISAHHLLDNNSSDTNPSVPRCHNNAVNKANKARATDDSGIFYNVSSATHLSYCQETGKHLLKKFSSQAESPFGRGVLENLLLRGSKEELEECVLALPLLCRTKKMKQQMLVGRKGLRKFCDLFTSASPNSETFTIAVESLVVLANDLQVKFPVDSGICPSKILIDDSCGWHKVKCLRVDPDGSEIQNCITSGHDCLPCWYNDNCFGSHDVYFQMDNGNVVSAHKQVMETASDVFTAMLSGCFSESLQSVISIPDVSSNVFEFALHHIYGCTLLPGNEEEKEVSSASCSWEMCKKTVSELKSKGKKLQFLSELLAFSDRFMLDGLRTVCELFLINLIDTTTVVQICNLGLRLNSPQLCTHCLSYLLQLKISDLPNSLHLFKELFLCAYRKDLVEQLYGLLLPHLK